MSKYSLLGVCQPQRGGLSYFCGLSLPSACNTTRDGHSDRDRRSGDGPAIPPDRSSTRESRIPFDLPAPSPPPSPPPQSNIPFLFSRPRSFLRCDLERLRAIRSIMSMPSLRGLRDSRGNWRDRVRKAERMEEGELPVLATWIHVPVSRSAEKRGLRDSINMRMTRATWFCALPDAHRVRGYFYTGS